MQHLSELFKEIPKPTVKSERAEIISFFIEGINEERPSRYLKNGKWKIVKKIETTKEKGQIAVMLSVLKTKQELQEFLSVCKDYKNRHGSFSRRFYGGFKEQKFNKL